jgi:hypothetical protein
LLLQYKSTNTDTEAAALLGHFPVPAELSGHQLGRQGRQPARKGQPAPPAISCTQSGSTPFPDYSVYLCHLIARRVLTLLV